MKSPSPALKAPILKGYSIPRIKSYRRNGGIVKKEQETKIIVSCRGRRESGVEEQQAPLSAFKIGDCEDGEHLIYFCIIYPGPKVKNPGINHA